MSERVDVPDHALVGPHRRNVWRCAPERVDLVRQRAPARSLALPAEPQEIVLDLERTALIVVDMQNDFCSPGGWMDEVGADLSVTHAPVAALAGLIPVLRQHEVPIVWVNWGNRRDLANMPPAVFNAFNRAGARLGVGSEHALDEIRGAERAMVGGTWASAVIDELATEPSDLHVAKHRQSGFWGTELDTVLRHLDVTTLLVAGVYLDVCVNATIIDGSSAGYDCVLLTDCTATLSPPFCQQAVLWGIRNVWGFCSTAADVTAALARA